MEKQLKGGIYERPVMVPMSDYEGNGEAPSGVPVAVFILVAAVTVVAATFIVGASVGWNVAVGTNAVVSTSVVTKSK